MCASNVLSTCVWCMIQGEVALYVVLARVCRDIQVQKCLPGHVHVVRFKQLSDRSSHDHSVDAV